ncbi:MAG: hypothetical protein LC793_16110 [Thermomicrobia bacterium]|nr:hypothetical protein [Thermomicrobia bacterium]
MGRSRRWLGFLCTLALIGSLIVPAGGALADGGNPVARQLVSGGTATLRAAPDGSDTFQSPELPPGLDSDQASSVVNRSFARDHGARPPQQRDVPVVGPSAIAGSNPGLGASFNGLNFREQRLANGGNQYSLEPPDQGLCVGNGFVLESVNDVLRVFDTTGSAQIGVTDLNTFYGYPAAINRTTGVRGPFVTDPSCYYDTDTQRWFQVALTLDMQPNGAFTGKNHLDIAVSTTASPTGSWKIYRLPGAPPWSSSTTRVLRARPALRSGPQSRRRGSTRASSTAASISSARSRRQRPAIPPGSITGSAFGR